MFELVCAQYPPDGVVDVLSLAERPFERCLEFRDLGAVDQFAAVGRQRFGFADAEWVILEVSEG